MTSDPKTLAEKVLAGDRLPLARLLTLIENDIAEGLEALSLLYPSTGQAHLIGITGAPGTGKSTLVNRLAEFLRNSPQDADSHDQDRTPRVAIVAVDPSSPFSGGAILGDRIRMRDLAGDQGVFIRSMASRGAVGGLAKATASVAEALDAAGFGTILIETVGAGQAEVEIARTAHTTVVITAPGLGDEIQAIKAGILEIADILVVNKSDMPGADNTVRILQSALRLGFPENSNINDTDLRPTQAMEWIPPILSTVATTGVGIPELGQVLMEHGRYLEQSGERRRREREHMRFRLDQLLRDHLIAQFLEEIPDRCFEALIDKVLARELEPRRAVKELIQGKLGD